MSQSPASKATGWLKGWIFRAFRYYVCPHRWCWREVTYDHRCGIHQDDL